MTSANLMAFHNGETVSDKDLLELLTHYPGIFIEVKTKNICRVLGNYDKLAYMLNDVGGRSLETVRDKLLQELHRRHDIHSFGNSEFYESTFLPDLEEIPLLREGFKGKKVIELGPERNPVYPHLAKHGIAGYTAVEPNYADETSEALKGHDGKTDVVKVDGLSYLLSQPNDSAVVISFGVLPWCGNSYMESIAQEIYRVTPPGGISVHSPKIDRIERYPYVETGFKPIEELIKGLDTRCAIFVKPSKN